MVKEETAGKRQEVVHEGGDGENERELLVLSTAICRQRNVEEPLTLWWADQNSGSHKEIELTCDPRSIGRCRVDAQRAEVALRLQNENQGSPPKHGSGKTQALHQTRGKGEVAQHA